MTSNNPRPAGVVDALLDGYVCLEQELDRLNGRARHASGDHATRLLRRRALVDAQLRDLSAAVHDVLAAHDVRDPEAAVSALIAAHRSSREDHSP